MSRTNRVKVRGEAFYHVISRVANAEFLFRDPDRKRALLRILRKSADFSGVRVLAYAVMDNHFHLCVATPEAAAPDDAELLRRVEVLYGRARREALGSRLAAPGGGDDPEAARLRARMGDLSEFAKTFKQRVTQWFNARHGHVGTLWTGRFKSVLLEDGARVRAVANYIHANPVRAGIVEDAREYGWSSLGAAVRGDIFAARGLALIGIRPDAESSRMAGICPARDLRLSNAVVAGSRAYVERMASHFGRLLSGRAARMARFAMCGIEFFSTHGQRSCPKNAA